MVAIFSQYAGEKCMTRVEYGDEDACVCACMRVLCVRVCVSVLCITGSERSATITNSVRVGPGDDIRASFAPTT